MLLFGGPCSCWVKHFWHRTHLKEISIQHGLCIVSRLASMMMDIASKIKYKWRDQGKFTYFAAICEIRDFKVSSTIVLLISSKIILMESYNFVFEMVKVSVRFFRVCLPKLQFQGSEINKFNFSTWFPNTKKADFIRNVLNKRGEYLL